MNVSFKRIARPKDERLPVATVEPVAEVTAPAPLPVAREPLGNDDEMEDAAADAAAAAAVAAVQNGRASGPHYPELSEKFLLAGRALFTVSNPKADHYTFRVRGKESEWPIGSGRMSMTYFVSVKASGGVYPYRYIGLLNKTTGDIKITAKSEFLPGTKEYDVAKWACNAVIALKQIPDGYHIEHAGRCGKCGRTLTDPVSIERGIGPECWKGL